MKVLTQYVSGKSCWLIAVSLHACLHFECVIKMHEALFLIGQISPCPSLAAVVYITMATCFERETSTQQDRSCPIHAQPKNALGSTAWVIIGLYTAFYWTGSDTSAAPTACLLRHNTMESNYYIIILVCGLELTRLAWVCNPVKNERIE